MRCQAVNFCDSVHYSLQEELKLCLLSRLTQMFYATRDEAEFKMAPAMNALQSMSRCVLTLQLICFGRETIECDYLFTCGMLVEFFKKTYATFHNERINSFYYCYYYYHYYCCCRGYILIKPCINLTSTNVLHFL